MNATVNGSIADLGPSAETLPAQIGLDQNGSGEVAKLATFPEERKFETPQGVVIGKLTRIRVSDLATDRRFIVRDIPNTSFRAGVRQQYLEAVCDGAQFPPLVVWKGTHRLIVLAGHHRLAAYEMRHKNYAGSADAKQNRKGNGSAAAGQDTDRCDAYLVECSEADAKHIARSENGTHGAPLTNLEKRAAYVQMRNDSYYEDCKSDRYFARLLGVTHGTIQNWRKEKRPRQKRLISPQEFYQQCLAIARRKIDCAAVYRGLTPEQLKVIGVVEDYCHKVRYGAATRTASGRTKRPA